ncbi:MAG: hypothetical protein ABIF19_10590 [Planctomycetota bacterium]
MNGLIMNVFLAQFVLARRNDEAEGWTNLLFVIVVAVFWALGGILKARANKPEHKDQTQSQRKLVRRPPAHGVQSWRQSTERTQPRQATPAQRPQYRPASKTPAVETVAAHPLLRTLAAQIERAAGRMFVPSPEPELPSPKQPQPAAKAAARPADKHPAGQVITVPAEYPPALLLDHMHPDDLRRAILYYEILGKPVSLRDSSESVIGL